MFATLAGGYPWTAGPPADEGPAADERPPAGSPVGAPPADEGLAAVLGAQVEAGLGLLADGRVHGADTPTDELVAAWRAARDAAARLAPGLPVKLAVTGPWSAGGPGGALEIARVLHASLVALAAIGCPVIEVHEPAASLPVGPAGREAFAAAHAALLADAGEGLHASLAITGGDAVGLGAEALFAAPYRSYLLDLLDGPESWRLVAVAPGTRGIVVGVGDASGRRRTRLDDVIWAASYAASTAGRGMERIGVAPSGSLADLPPDRAGAVLSLLGEAADALAGGRDAVLTTLDPRAIDARSAALGQYRPRRRRSPGT